MYGARNITGQFWGNIILLYNISAMRARNDGCFVPHVVSLSRRELTHRNPECIFVAWMKECQFVRTCQTPCLREDETETHWKEWICAKAKLGLNLPFLLPVSCSFHTPNSASLGWSYWESLRVKNHIVIQCLAIMTNFGAPGELLEVTTLLPTKYQHYKLLLVKKLVGVHHVHRNSWEPREQLLQNWSPMAHPSEIWMVLCCEVPMDEMMWYFRETIDCPLNKIWSNLSQKLHGIPGEIFCSSCEIHV